MSAAVFYLPDDDERENRRRHAEAVAELDRLLRRRERNRKALWMVALLIAALLAMGILIS